MTVDRFLVTHLKIIESSMKIVCSSQIQKFIFKTTTSKQNNYDRVEELVKQVTPLISPICLFSDLTSEEEYNWNLMNKEYSKKINFQHLLKILKKINITMKQMKQTHQQISIISPTCSIVSTLIIDEEET